MSRFIFGLLSIALSVADVANAQCAAADNPNCVYWVPNGFCTTAGYSLPMIQQYCPKSCANSGCYPTSTTPATVAQNANCDTWNNDPANVFCATATPEQKKTFCPTTCANEITSVDDCAIYVNVGGSVVRTPTNSSTTPLPTGVTATDLLLDVFAQNKCTISLYDIAAPTLDGATPTAPKMVYKGTGSSQFFQIADAVGQAALSIGCTCP